VSGLLVRGALAVWDTSGSSGDLFCDPVTGRFLPNASDDYDVLDASGCIVTAGLVNAHHHLLQTAFRSLPGTRGVPMREWLAVMGAAYRRTGVDPSLAAAAAAVGLAESLLRGVTTVADHHLTWPSGADHLEIASAVASVARSLGARLVFVRGSAGDDPSVAASSAAEIVEALAPSGVTADGMLQIAVGPAGVHSDSPETFKLLGEVAARYGLRRRTQANEQVDVAVALERYGRRPLELLDDWGWLAPDVTIAHLCGITGPELRRVASSGATATHAPGCDVPMGWGIAPAAALADAGVVVGLGTSGGGSNDAGHLLADARLALQVAPLAPSPAEPLPALNGRTPAEPAPGPKGRPDAAHTGAPPGSTGRPVAAREVLGWATAGSAAGLGRPELGSLAVGAAADLVCWPVDGVADAGVADPVGGLLWADPGRRPRHVVVAGRVVVRDGRLVTADADALARSLTGLLAARSARS
jgi:8-oxoguanine deaminase